MAEDVWIYDNRKVSEYVSYNAYGDSTLQVHEYLLRDERIENPVKDLR